MKSLDYGMKLPIVYVICEKKVLIYTFNSKKQPKEAEIMNSNA